MVLGCRCRCWCWPPTPGLVAPRCCMMVLIFGGIPFTDATIVRYVDDRICSRGWCAAGPVRRHQLAGGGSAGPGGQVRRFLDTCCWACRHRRFTALVVAWLPGEPVPARRLSTGALVGWLRPHRLPQRLPGKPSEEGCRRQWRRRQTARQSSETAQPCAWSLSDDLPWCLPTPFGDGLPPRPNATRAAHGLRCAGPWRPPPTGAAVDAGRSSSPGSSSGSRRSQPCRHARATAQTTDDSRRGQVAGRRPRRANTAWPASC